MGVRPARKAEKAANAEGARKLGFGDPEPALERIRSGAAAAALVLGHDVLARFVVRLDYPRRRLWLARDESEGDGASEARLLGLESLEDHAERCPAGGISCVDDFADPKGLHPTRRKPREPQRTRRGNEKEHA